MHTTVKARVVINCAGLYGDCVERFRTSQTSTRDCTADSAQGAAHISTEPARGAGEKDEPGFEVTARKGQFVVFGAPESSAGSDVSQAGAEATGSAVSQAGAEANLLPEHIIEPVATEFTKGVIVWVTVHGNVVVGPTAVDQSSKTDRTALLSSLVCPRAFSSRDGSVLTSRLHMCEGESVLCAHLP